MCLDILMKNRIERNGRDHVEKQKSTNAFDFKCDLKKLVKVKIAPFLHPC